MSACIGWKADPECPVYGEMHGCKLPDGHKGRHACLCATDTTTASALPSTPVSPGGCGTDRGYRAHLRAGEEACGPCRAARAAASREWAKRNRWAGAEAQRRKRKAA